MNFARHHHNLIFFSKVVGRYCIPSMDYFTTYLKDLSSIFDSGDTIEKWISDIKNSWHIILASLGIAFLVG